MDNIWCTGGNDARESRGTLIVGLLWPFFHHVLKFIHEHRYLLFHLQHISFQFRHLRTLLCLCQMFPELFELGIEAVKLGAIPIMLCYVDEASERGQRRRKPVC